MSLLRDIQEGATGETVSPSVLLRQVKVLASRLSVPAISAWAESELSGYESIEGLPSYRGPFQARVLADLSGPFGSGVKNFAVPPMAVGEEYREGNLFKITFFQGVAELQSLIGSGGDLKEPWSADTVAGIRFLLEGGNVTIDPDMHFVAVWKIVTRPMLVGVLDAVRNRLLDFALRLGTEDPSAEADVRAAHPDRVAQIFQTTVYAGAANLALGNRDVNQTIQLPRPGDEVGLLRYLHDIGMDPAEVDQLRVALAADAAESERTTPPKGSPGRRVLTWLKDTSAASAGKVGSGVAVSLATQAILHYFGI